MKILSDVADCWILNQYTVSLNMISTAILIPVGNPSVVNIEGTRQILSWVNSFMESKGNNPVFDIELVYCSHVNGAENYSDAIPIIGAQRPELVIIPAVHGPWQEVRQQNSNLIAWLKTSYDEGSHLVSYCIAAFLVAQSGILDGKRCSTHWEAANEFRSLFPGVNLQDEKMIVEDQRIFSCGGAYGFTNLLMYLIERFVNYETAVMAAKTFMIDLSKNNQAFYSVFNGLKSHGDPQILKAQEYLETYYYQKINLTQIAQLVHLSERTLQRRFKKHTYYTPIQYLQHIRIEKTKRLLTDQDRTVDQIMWDVGYEDANHFRSLFRSITGKNPVAYRNGFLLN